MSEGGSEEAVRWFSEGQPAVLTLKSVRINMHKAKITKREWEEICYGSALSCVVTDGEEDCHSRKRVQVLRCH